MFLINAVLKSKALYNMLLKKAASAKNYEKNIPRTPKRKISINNEAIKKKQSIHKIICIKIRIKMYKS